MERVEGRVTPDLRVRIEELSEGASESATVRELLEYALRSRWVRVVHEDGSSVLLRYDERE